MRLSRCLVSLALSLFLLSPAAGMAQTTLRIGYGWADTVTDAFESEYPNIALEMVENFLSEGQTVADHLRSGSDAVDIYLITLRDGLAEVLREGLAADLSPNPDLVADALSLPKALGNALADQQGHVWGVAQWLEISSWEVNSRLWTAYLPNALLDRLQIWLDTQGENLEVSLLPTYRLAQNLTQAALSQYIRLSSREVLPITFSDDGLLSALEGIKALPLGVNWRSEEDGLPEEDLTLADEREQWALISDWLSFSQPFNGITQERARLPIPVFYLGQPPLYPGEVWAYVVNPASPHQTEAAAFLSYYVANRDWEDNAILHPEDAGVSQQSLAENLGAYRQAAAGLYIDWQESALPNDPVTYQALLQALLDVVCRYYADALSLAALPAALSEVYQAHIH